MASTPLSASPGRASLSRPDWPWSRYNHRSSQSSLNSPINPSTPGASASQSSWSAVTSSSSSNHTTTMPWSSSVNRQSTSSNMVMSPTVGNHTTTKHWTFSAFEWVVHDVQKLKDFVEGTTQSNESDNLPSNDDFEILKESPMMGDGKFKLEIARTPPPEAISPTQPDSLTQTLTLSITSLTLDFPHIEYETSASLVAAIKCHDDRVGARIHWIWEFWQENWLFRHNSEVWECPLPLLSSLLENPRIRETDSFVISVQMHCPTGPYFPSHPQAYYVPRDLLDGLEASLDNSNTGDVRFICLEKYRQAQPSSPPGSPTSAISSSSHSPFSTQVTARKRVIYAHSDIISRRSEYFATLLSSSFSENAPALAPGDRKLCTIIVEEADFETVYWLLKWVYGNWLLFKENDDPRVAVDTVGEGWSNRWLNARGGEWDWKTFRKTAHGDGSIAGARDDSRSVASAESRRSSDVGGSSGSKGKQPPSSPQSQTSTTPISSSSVRAATGSRVIPTIKSPTPLSAASRQSNASITGARRISTTSNPGTSTLSPHSITKAVPISLSTSNFPTPSHIAHRHYPVSPHAQGQHMRVQSSPIANISTNSIDPHPHPTPAPQPASALSMYQIAHRYAIPGLANLALEHMVSTITPQSSFPLLLATNVWDELRSLIEDYVVERWDEVSISEEFELSCQEVAAGEWGIEGGKTLTALFRRLRSPVAYARA